MTRKSLRINIILSILFLISVNAIIISTGIIYPGTAELLKSITTISIAISGAWLGACFQKRISYSNALRALWDKIVDTVQESILYTSKPNRSEEEYFKLLHKIRCRIDEVRAVFRNTGERYIAPSNIENDFVSGVRKSLKIESLYDISNSYNPDRSHIGVYPFESLKQIHHVIVLLGYDHIRYSPDAREAHKVIVALWKIMRAELLKELDRDFAEFPNAPHLNRKALEEWKRKFLLRN